MISHSPEFENGTSDQFIRKLSDRDNDRRHPQVHDHASTHRRSQPTQNDDDIDTYIHRHGVAGLATALTDAVARERGKVTNHLITQDLDISPLAAEMILHALVVNSVPHLSRSLHDLNRTAKPSR